MFGDSYLVAPILTAGAVSRDVYLPAGLWTHIFSSANYTGGRNYSVPAPLDSFPVFARASA
jgi:alpha-glucosidase (family GH31 glycosyl hydrolase)